MDIQCAELTIQCVNGMWKTKATSCAWRFFSAWRLQAMKERTMYNSITLTIHNTMTGKAGIALTVCSLMLFLMTLVIVFKSQYLRQIAWYKSLFHCDAIAMIISLMFIPDHFIFKYPSDQTKTLIIFAADLFVILFLIITLILCWIINIVEQSAIDDY